MTWFSKMWTQVNMIVKTWHPPQFWNPTFFKTATFLGNSMSPSLDNDVAIQDLAFQVLKLLGQRISTLDPYRELCLSWLGLPRCEHNWTFLQDLAATGLKSNTFCSRLGMPSFEMLLHFCNSMSPSLDNDCPTQDLAFQVLKLHAV